MGSSFQPGHRRDASSFGSVLSFESITDAMNCDVSTDVLLKDAYDIAKEWDNDSLKKNGNKHIFTGIFLKALLDNASPRPIHPEEEPDYVTGIRYTGAVIKAAYAERKVREVAEAWLNCMVYPMKAAGHHRTTQPSTEHTRGIEDVAANVEPSSRSGQAVLRGAVLKRDKYHCVVHNYEADRHLEDNDFPFYLEVAHILPFSLNTLDGNDSTSVYNAAVTWTMIQNWTSVDIKTLLDDGINDPSNALLLCPNFHRAFDLFDIYFEAKGIPNQYNVLFTRSLKQAGQVQFIDHSNVSISLPNRRYLELHAAFAKVLHTTGVGEYFDKVFKDRERIGALATDGSSDLSVLVYGLLQLAVH